MLNIEWAECRIKPYICDVLSGLVYITIDKHIVAFYYTVGWSNDVNAGASRLVTGSHLLRDHLEVIRSEVTNN
ncbi:hypothetical protein R3I94_005378 [Phoxinus phoxinus]|uniref:Uncharacterized protein n=1 Tax=Phoxinus phoxinus TaxID=58324 RepID=A0AAN9DAF6_9TELE